MCMYICVYIYIYRERERASERERQRRHSCTFFLFGVIALRSSAKRHGGVWISGWMDAASEFLFPLAWSSLCSVEFSSTCGLANVRA